MESGFDIRLVDYKGGSITVTIGKLEDIARIIIRVVTGDEIADVVYKDYSTMSFDSDTNDRRMDFYDGEIEVYNFNKPREENLLFDPKWIKRTNSYSYLYGYPDDDEEEDDEE